MMIVKIGGGAGINAQGIIRDLAQMDEPCILVHGANAARDKLASDLGQPKKVLTSLKGYSSVYSDEKAIDILMMAYAGLRNKRIVEMCQQHGINAVGLSGIDGKLIQGKRNLGIKTMIDGKKKIIRDFSGKPQTVNADLITTLLEKGYTPVITQPLVDENGFAINSDNDDVVGAIENVMHADVILQFIEEPGFLDNKEDPSSLVPRITQEELAQREAQVEGRMKRKMLALKKLFESGAKKVIIADGRVEHPVQDALHGKGTIIE